MQKHGLRRVLGIDYPAIVAFYGAGGKTTLLGVLAAELAAAGHNILVTTTTKMYKPPGKIILHNSRPEQTAEKITAHLGDNSPTILGKRILPDGKIEGVDPGLIDFLHQNLQLTILVEADGAKGKSLKGYNYYEPVIPKHSNYIIPILGGDALEKPLTAKNTHRLEIFAASTGAKKGEKITAKTFADAFCHMFDLGKKQAPRALACLIINKADQVSSPGKEALAIASLVKGSLKDYFPDKLLITEGQNTDPVKIVLNLNCEAKQAKVSCVVLAAGQSTRMGRAKLALKTKGKTILEETVGEIIAAGIKNIVMVTAPGRSEWIGLPGSKRDGDVSIKVVENPHYHTGLASSLKTGLQAVDPDTQGIMFALADQPHIPASVYHTICEKYQRHLPLVTCPVFKNKRGNPVLFDRRTWPDLMKLKGDQGGRAVITEIRVEQRDYVDVDTPSVLWDIDSPEDYLAYLDSLNT